MKSCPLRYWVALASALLCLSESHHSAAQIIPDATLPVNSIVTPQGITSVIEGGTKAGGNLFHSFREFSIPTGAEAFFNNALDVQNIFSRVTGRSISHIDGLIRANGAANLFLLNPNGIIFGPNAQLNIGGSFLASTANSIKFADGTFFSTTNPQTSPLLTISVPVGLQMGPNPGNIVVQGSGHNLSYDPWTGAIIRDNRPVGLQVAPGQTFALLGGNLALEGGNLTAEGGRIELGSVGGDTLVTLTPINQGMALSYPGIENFQDISLSRAASVDASGAGGGDVFVAGRRVTLSDGSAIFALTEGAEPGGTLSVRASEVLEVTGSTPDGQFPSGLFASVEPGATGDGDHVTIETARLRVADGAQVSAITFGSGKAGNLTVKATDTVEVIGNSGLYTSDSSGDGGNVTIETGRLTLQDGALIYTSTFGQGKAGNVTVKASDAIELIGNSSLYTVGLSGDGGNVTIETGRLTLQDGASIYTGTDGQGKGGNVTVKASDVIELISNSGFYTSAASDSTGDVGNVTIETGRLTLQDGANISTSTFGQGKAGNVTVKASDAIELIGNSGLYTSGSSGDGGNVTIETGRLTLQDGANIYTFTLGQGKAGNVTVKASDAIELIGSGLYTSAASDSTGDVGYVTIETGRLTLKDRALVYTSTLGQGKAGNVTVQASDAIELIGNSGLYTSGSSGDSGDVTIETGWLTLKDGALIYTSTLGQGKAGNVTVQASDAIELIGRSYLSTSGLSGDGGNVTIETGRLTVKDGALIYTGAFGQGQAGNLTVQASDAIELIGNSGLYTSAESGSTGRAGNVTIETARLRVADGAILAVRSRGEGKAGDLIVDADSIAIENSGSLTADTKAGGGSIELRSPTITLRRGSSITTNATGEEVTGGNINIDSDVLAALENSDISANSDNFFGGQVFINTQGIFGAQFRDATTPESDITATGKDSAFSGTVTINTPDVDPSSGLIELSQNFVNVTGLVADQCSSARQRSSFTVTGRGGIPPSPDEPLSSEIFLADLIPLPADSTQSQRVTSQTVSQETPTQMGEQIVEATGWLINEKGQVVLTASASNVTPSSPWFTPPGCPVSVR